MAERDQLTPLRFVRFGALILAFAVIGFPPGQIIIETGTIGGSYYATALKYRDALRKRGITAIVLTKADTLDIVGDVERHEGGADVGFTAQAVRHEDFPHITSAGAIELQPLFIFCTNTVSSTASLAALRGMRIVLPGQRSASTEAALGVLGLYGVTPENTQITYLPLVDAAKALKAGRFDAGFFMLDPSNPLVVELSGAENLHFLSLKDERAISRLVPFLHSATLPRSVYDVRKGIPPDDVAAVAAKVNVILRDDIRPAMLYPLLDAMNDVHGGATLVSDAGEFPTLVGTDLPPHPLAREYAKSGAPWYFQDFPLPLASIIDSYLGIAVAAFLLGETLDSEAYLSQFLDFLIGVFGIAALARRARKRLSGYRAGRLAAHLAERALSYVLKRKWQDRSTK
jgi:TRAP-type uncharacterized transport system substrate-binding protein